MSLALRHKIRHTEITCERYVETCRQMHNTFAQARESLKRHREWQLYVPGDRIWWSWFLRYRIEAKRLIREKHELMSRIKLLIIENEHSIIPVSGIRRVG